MTILRYQICNDSKHSASEGEDKVGYVQIGLSSR